MTERERLELEVDVTGDFGDLETVASELEGVDREISDAGRGHDSVYIDVEVESADAIFELGEVATATEAIDDDVTIDVDTNTDVDALTAFTDSLTAVTSGGRSFDDLDGTLGSGTNTDDVIGSRQLSSIRHFAEISENIDQMDAVRAEGRPPRLTTDFIPETHFEGRFGEGSGAISPQRFERLMAFQLDDETPFLDLRDSMDSSRETLVDLDDTAARLADIQEDMTDPNEVLLDEDNIEVTRSDINRQNIREQNFRAEVDLFGEGGQTIDEAMDMPDLFEGRRKGRKSFTQRIEDIRETLGNLEFTVRGLHQAFASLVPIIIQVALTLPAVITALGGLAIAAIGAAGALAGVAGLGLMGISLQETGELSMDPIREELGELQDSFIEAFGPLAQALAPTVRRVLTDIQMMMGPLASASGVLLDLSSAIEGFVSRLTGGLPDVVEGMLRFTNAAMPLFSAFADFLADIDFLGFFADALADTIPFIIIFGQGIARMIPPLVNFSQGVLAVTGTLFLVIGTILKLVDILGPLTEIIGVVTGAFLTASFAVGFYNFMTRGATGILLTHIKASIALIAVKAKEAAAVATATLMMKGFTFATAAATVAVGALLTLLGIGLVAIPAAAAAVDHLAKKFNVLGGNVSNARDELKKLGQTGNELDSFDGGLGVGGDQGRGRASGVYRDNSTTIINADGKDSAARQQYANEYEKQQRVDSIFGSGA